MAASINKFATTLTYNKPITASNITVEYDGHLCNVARDEFGGYGNEGLRSNPASEGLPFYIIYKDSQNIVYTSTLGQHTIEISISESSVKTTKCFKKAVKSISAMMLKYSGINIKGATWQEAFAMLNNGVMLFLNNEGTLMPCHYYNDEAIAFISTIVDTDVNQVCTWKYEWTPDGAVQYTESIYPPQS